jgi:hypothetical protein
MSEPCVINYTHIYVYIYANLYPPSLDHVRRVIFSTVVPSVPRMETHCKSCARNLIPRTRPRAPYKVLDPHA